MDGNHPYILCSNLVSIKPIFTLNWFFLPWYTSVKNQSCQRASIPRRKHISLCLKCTNIPLFMQTDFSFILVRLPLWLYLWYKKSCMIDDIWSFNGIINAEHAELFFIIRYSKLHIAWEQLHSLLNWLIQYVSGHITACYSVRWCTCPWPCVQSQIIFPDVNPLCDKCKTGEASHLILHVFWTCPSLKKYWRRFPNLVLHFHFELEPFLAPQESTTCA